MTSLVSVRFPDNQRRLQEVTAPNQEIEQHPILPKTPAYCFYSLFSVLIKQRSYQVFIGEL